MTAASNGFPPIQKITIVGMGAIGSVFAAWLGSRLPAGQIRLSALARGQTLTALQNEGLRWTGDDGTAHHLPLHATDDAAALGPQDLVIVTVKGPAMPQVAQQIQPLLGAHTVVLVAMNGVPWWFFDGLGGACDKLALRTVDPRWPHGSGTAHRPCAGLRGACQRIVCGTGPIGAHQKQPAHHRRTRRRCQPSG
jgi:2-dehydropantoate 2-reductase